MAEDKPTTRFIPATSATNPSITSSSSRTKVPDFKQSVRLKYVKLGYHVLITYGMYLLLSPLLIIFATQLSTFSFQDMCSLWVHLHEGVMSSTVLYELTRLQLNLGSKSVQNPTPQYNLVFVIICSSLVVFLSTVYFMTCPRPVYLVDFACYKPDKSLKCPKSKFMEKSEKSGAFSDQILAFQRKIIERSGLGDDTYLPETLVNNSPSNPSMSYARKEVKDAMFGVIDGLLAKTKVKPKEIGILIVNCSAFNPAPSLSSMIVSHYKLRGSILSYNIGGMGCSAGVIAIDLAKQLLQVHPYTYALVLSTESITLNWYLGKERSMLVSNCLFRLGAAAILLSNKRSDRTRSKYQLVHTVRTHKGSDDKCFSCAYQQEDQTGMLGISLSKELMAVAGDALKTNITTLGPLFLPISEQLLFLATLLAKKFFKLKIKPYIPNFKLAFEHFCIHDGGRAVLDEMEKNLQLSNWHMEPSRMTLYRFGNTSSSSLWYELAYSEAKGRMSKGDRVWQIAFGSGFKCNSAVWKALRTIDPATEKNPWMNEIHKFPVNVPKASPV